MKLPPWLSSSPNVSKQLDLLFLLPVALGLVGINLYQYSAGNSLLNDSYAQAGRHLQLSRDLVDLSGGLKTANETDRRQLRTAVNIFEFALTQLDLRGELLEHDPFSDPGEMS